MLAGRDIAAPRAATNAEQLRVFEFGNQMKNLVHLIGDASTRECVVVDGMYDPAGIVRAAEAIGCNVTAYVASHYHYDHIGSRMGSTVQPAAPTHVGELPGMRYF